MQATSHTPVFIFDGFRLDPDRRLLLKGDGPVSLHPKTLELLLVLVENRDRVMSKTELLNTIWEGQVVEENNLVVRISALRRVFGEKSNEHRFIVTVPGRGYRFVAEVTSEGELPAFGETNGTPTANHIAGIGESKIPILRYAIATVVIVAGAAVFYWLAGNRTVRTEPRMTRLTASGKVSNATISADEKFIVFAQEEVDGESLWLRQIETGGQTRIVPSRSTEYVGLSISPDNNFIYFSTFADNNASTPLMRIPLLGGGEERVGNIESGVSVSFSPDGKQFAYTEGHSALRESYLKIADADGANSRVVSRASEHERVIEDHGAGPAAWSPDGSKIALAVSETVADGRKLDGVLLVDPNGGEELFGVAPQFRSIHSVAWQDDNTLAFVGLQSDAFEFQVWSADVRTGEPRRITNDVQNYVWMSASKSGRLLTLQKNSVASLRIAPVDRPETSRELLHEPDITAVAVSRDNSILYTSRLGGTREIWRVGQDGADPQQVTGGAHVVKSFAVSPRDASLVFTSAATGENSLWISDASGKNLRRLTDGQDFYPDFTPDGSAIVFQRGSQDVPTTWRLTLDGESKPVELVASHSLNPMVSPDGTRTAFYFMDNKTDRQWRIGLVSTTTGEFLGKLDILKPTAERRMRWHPNDNVLAQTFNTGDTANLILVPIDGGESRVIANLGKGIITSFSWSADGRTLVYLLVSETEDAVSLTNF